MKKARWESDANGLGAKQGPLARERRDGMKGSRSGAQTRHIRMLWFGCKIYCPRFLASPVVRARRTS